jgi:hypothetical protein
VKKLIRYAVTAVVVMWVITNPTSAAALAHKAEAAAVRAAHSLSTLASAL